LMLRHGLDPESWIGHLSPLWPRGPLTDGPLYPSGLRAPFRMYDTKYCMYFAMYCTKYTVPIIYLAPS
jgi:hypothetical protein